MGASDFSDTIFSIGAEGQQNLILLNLNDYETEEDDLITNWINFPEADENDLEDGNNYTDKLATTDERNPMNIIEPHHDDIFFTGTDGSAVLEIVTFAKAQKVDKNNFAKLVQQGDYIKRYSKEYTYSWDHWDFVDPDTEEKLGYDDATDQNMTIIWKILDKKGSTSNNTAKSLRAAHPNEQIWIRNYSKHTFENYINTTTLNPYVSNVELSYVSYLLGIDYIGMTRLDAFSAIKKHLNIPAFCTTEPDNILMESHIPKLEEVKLIKPELSPAINTMAIQQPSNISVIIEPEPQTITIIDPANGKSMPDTANIPIESQQAPTSIVDPVAVNIPDSQTEAVNNDTMDVVTDEVITLHKTTNTVTDQKAKIISSKKITKLTDNKPILTQKPPTQTGNNNTKKILVIKNMRTGKQLTLLQRQVPIACSVVNKPNQYKPLILKRIK